MPRTSKSHVEADRPLARRIGRRIRRERLRLGLTQEALARPRYTKAYVSALEHGLVKPSMAALNYLADRLAVPVSRLLADEGLGWARLEADLHLASGEWETARLAYAALLEQADDPLTRAEVLARSAEALVRLDRGREALAFAREAADRFEAAGRAADAADARYWLAAAHHLAENAAEARVLLLDLERRLAEGLAGPTADFGVRVLITLAVVEGREGRTEAALAYLETARARLPQLDDRRRATFLHSLALNYRELGDMEGAIATATQCLALYRAVDADAEVGALDNELALTYLAMGDRSRAGAHVSAAIERLRGLGDQRVLAHAEETLAQVRLADGDLDGAARAAREALSLARSTGNRKASVSALLTLARIARQTADLDRAEALLGEAAELAEAAGRTAQLRDVLAEWSDTVAASGDLSRALELSRQALGAARASPLTEPLPSELDERPGPIEATGPIRGPLAAR
jgi:transcriptional regulator with XRE-family HTH domain